MLPIRRLALKDGQSGTTTTAWILMLDMTVRPYPQKYTRLNDEDYLFEGLEDDFEAELSVDELGLVTDYLDAWQAITQLPR